MERLAIIGANESINLLIQKAKELGYETHVFAWQSGDVGEKNADYFYPVSIDKKEEILNICKTIQPVGVCSITSDYAVQTVNYVARGLGLTGNSVRSDLVSRNKFEMRKALKENKLHSPWFIRVSGNYDLELSRELTYPLIVKPTDRWSSKGVCRVNGPEELSAAVKKAIAEAFEQKAILEEFIEGPEYSCESITYAGRHQVLAFTKKYTTGYPHYIETGHMQPSDLSLEQQEKIIPIIYNALDALDIQNGATHTEFRLSKNGDVGIIEIGARMGGDCIGSDLVQISTGYDYIRMVIETATGKEPGFYIVNPPKMAVIKYILTTDDLQKLQVVKEKYPNYLWRCSEIGDIGTREVTDSSTRFGYFIFAIDQEDREAIKEITALLGK